MIGKIQRRKIRPHAFITVTDFEFFPGTLATVNSILQFDRSADVLVINNHQRPLAAEQERILSGHKQVQIVDSRRLRKRGRHIGAFELKAYASCDLCDGYAVIVLIDSDCVLCSPVDQEIARCLESGGFLGGNDGDGTDYDSSYAVYGMAAPCWNPKYMSTSLLFCAVTEENKRRLVEWARCCSAAEFNHAGPYPGHGDQGVLNAVLFAAGQTEKIELLDNRLWSQHWLYWDSAIGFDNGIFINRSAGNLPQHCFHCGGTEKFWTFEHRERVVERQASQTYPYVWFLTMLWFGACRDWQADPLEYLPPASHHLLGDLADFYTQIAQVFPRATAIWNELTDTMAERILHGVEGLLPLGGELKEVADMIDAHESARRYVQVGSREGGSIFPLALRYLNRDLDFYAVESFLSDSAGGIDSHASPSRARFLANLAKFPALRVKLLPGESWLVAGLFAGASVDFVFIDSCHAGSVVLRIIDAWRSRVAAGGVMAGNGYARPAVREAVDSRFADVQLAPSGGVWWTRL